MFFKKRIIKKFKEKLRNSKIRQKELIKKERNKFISILNHDIKTPVLAQNQSLKLLLEGNFGSLNSEQKEILKELYSSNNFLLEVVLNSIFLTKYENENPKLNIENIDVVQQVKSCCELIKGFADEKQQNIIIRTNAINDIKLNADKKMIQKIIFNILASSVSSGFENSDIEISIKENENSIAFYTKNKSIYMTKEKINSLFEEKKGLCDFNQLGLNLNLNIAKKLITAHNWDIIAKSEKDNSSTFGFVVRK